MQLDERKMKVLVKRADGGCCAIPGTPTMRTPSPWRPAKGSVSAGCRAGSTPRRPRCSTAAWNLRPKSPTRDRTPMPVSSSPFRCARQIAKPRPQDDVT